MSLLRFWEILRECHRQRVVISLVSDDLREFAFDGVVEVETDGPSACARLAAEGDLYVWIDDYSEREIIINVSHSGISPFTGVARLLCAFPLGYDELLLRVVAPDGTVLQKWPD